MSQGRGFSGRTCSSLSPGSGGPLTGSLTTALLTRLPLCVYSGSWGLARMSVYLCGDKSAHKSRVSYQSELGCMEGERSRWAKEELQGTVPVSGPARPAPAAKGGAGNTSACRVLHWLCFPPRRCLPVLRAGCPVSSPGSAAPGAWGEPGLVMYTPSERSGHREKTITPHTGWSGGS